MQSVTSSLVNLGLTKGIQFDKTMSAFSNKGQQFKILHFQIYFSVVVFQLVPIQNNPFPTMLCLCPAPSWRPPVLTQERHFSWGRQCAERVAATPNTWRIKKMLL